MTQRHRIASSPHFPALARSIPFALFIAALAVRGAVGERVDSRWLYALQAGAGATALWMLWGHYSELRLSPLARIRSFQALLSIGVGLVVFALWVSLTEPWMRLSEPAAKFVPVHADGSLQWGLISLRLFGAVLVVPLLEELFWRSYLMRRIDRVDFLALTPDSVSAFSLIASSAVFALAHDLWLAGLLAGLAFGLLYRLTGQIWHAITAHAAANLALGIWVVHQRAWGFW